MSDQRERDIRNKIQTLLIDTGAFDDGGVSLVGLPEYQGSAASLANAVFIQPQSTQENDLYDDAPAGAIEYTCNIAMVFVVRTEDPQMRDEQCELLFNTASDALNGQQLGDDVIYAKTRFTQWNWVEPVAPERQIKATFRVVYMVDGWDSLDTTP